MTRTAAETSRVLEQLRAAAARDGRARRPRHRPAAARQVEPARRHAPVRRAAALVCRLALLVVLPFAVLVRAAVELYAASGLPTWLALGLATAATAGIVTLYAAWVSHKLTGRARIAAMGKTVGVPLVVGYALFALLYLSAANAKSGAVRAEYRALHPILRVAVSTVVLADGDLVITDMARRQGDYAAMGLPPYAESRHARQPDGYAHALDLRTADRSAVASRLVQLYFELMGFETRRHGGTADHLHVELAARGRD